MSEDFDFSTMVAVVTGGTKGIGRAISRALLARGATVVAAARNEPSEPVAVGNAVAEFRELNVKDTEALDGFIEGVVADHGSLALLVNNAGGGPLVAADTAKPKLHRAIIELNLLAPLHLAQAANRVMQSQPDGGHIINIGSVVATRPAPGSAAYGAAKAGLQSLTGSLAIEWGPKVRVNGVLAGAILTEESREYFGGDAAVAELAAEVPVERMGVPEDVANAVVMLASPLSSFVNGESLMVHGGGESPVFSQKPSARGL